MKLGITLKAAEKVFGPALPGIGEPEKTLSAVRYAGGKAKKFAGVLGLPDHAIFHVHFPTPVDWSLAATTKGVPDFVSDLKESGPQGGQGRATEVAAFLANYGDFKTLLEKKLQKKTATAEKKILAAKKKTLMVEKKLVEARIREEGLSLRLRLAAYAGEREATFIIGSDSVSLPVKITVDKKGKVKIVATA